MATMTTVDDLDTYRKKYTDAAATAANQQIKAKKASDAESVTKYNTTVDNQVAATTGKYQQSIDNADKVYREQYDTNAIAELVNQKKLKEGMANAGLTDSGLNRTQQTALAVQRGNADAATRQQQQDYVNQLQNAIDEVVAAGEADKANYKNEVDTGTANWSYELMQNALQNAETDALNAHTAAQSAALEQYNADLTAVKEAEERYYDYLLKTAESESDYTQQRADYANNLMKNMGYTEEQALAAAGVVYPTGNETTDTYNRLYSQAVKDGYSSGEARMYAEVGGGEAGEAAVNSAAIQAAEAVVSGLALDVTKFLSGSFFNNQNGDGKIVADKLTNQLSASTAYSSMSATQKQATLSIAVGQMVAKSWPGGINEKDNVTRMQVACQKLGADYDAALAAYNAYRAANQ